MSYFVNILGPIIYFFNGRVPIRLKESFFILKYFLEGMRNEQGRKLILNQQSLILEHINQGNLTIFKYNHLYEKTLFIFVFIGLLNVDTICYQRGKQLWPRIIEIVSQGRFDNEFMFRIWNKIQRDTRILFESFGTFCIDAMHFWLLCDSVVLVLFLRQIRGTIIIWNLTTTTTTLWSHMV